MRFYRVIGAIVLVGLVLALGAGVYQLGVAAGAAGAAGTGAAVAPYHWYGPWFFPWFGIFPLFGFLLFIFLIFALFRLAFGGGRRGYGSGRWGDGWNGPNGQNGWEQRMREYHDRLHATGGQAAGSGAATPGSQWPSGGSASPVTRPDGASGSSGSGDPRSGG